ncbi:hypothetical protein [Paraburkholderia tropica]|nr:hypothetical protein [Paraburkholderia tropica]
MNRDDGLNGESNGGVFADSTSAHALANVNASRDEHPEPRNTRIKSRSTL